MEELIEKAVFVGIIRQNDDDRKVMEYLDELEFLAETAGAKGDKKFVQRLDKPEKATYKKRKAAGDSGLLRGKRDQVCDIR